MGEMAAGGAAVLGMRESGSEEAAGQCIEQTHRNGLLGESHELLEGLRGQGGVPLSVGPPAESHAIRVVSAAAKPACFDVLGLLGVKSRLRRNVRRLH